MKKENQTNCFDKGEAVLWAIRAYFHLKLGERENAVQCLRRAKEIARRFDAAPNYDVNSLQFVAGNTVASSVDDLGETAMKGISKVVLDFEDHDFEELWRTIENETQS